MAKLETSLDDEPSSDFRDILAENRNKILDAVDDVRVNDDVYDDDDDHFDPDGDHDDGCDHDNRDDRDDHACLNVRFRHAMPHGLYIRGPICVYASRGSNQRRSSSLPEKENHDAFPSHGLENNATLLRDLEDIPASQFQGPLKNG